jgi:hypothetical protein
MTRRRVLLGAAAVLLLASLLGALRDPPWLLRVASGFSQWETLADGTRYRWTGGHASFFVESSHSAVAIPLRATFSGPEDWPIVASITVDDRPVERLLLSDAEWRRATVRLPPRPSRHVRRIDIRVDRLRDGTRGIQVGEIEAR